MYCWCQLVSRFCNDYILEKARSFGRNGALDITFDSVPAIDGTEFTAVQGNEAKEKQRAKLKPAGASVVGAVLLGPVGLVGGAFIKGKNIDYPVGSTVIYSTSRLCIYSRSCYWW